MTTKTQFRGMNGEIIMAKQFVVIAEVSKDSELGKTGIKRAIAYSGTKKDCTEFAEKMEQATGQKHWVEKER